MSDEAAKIAGEWRAEALSWVGRAVRIVDGPSAENGRTEIGTVICVDATDYRPSAWVKISEYAPGARRQYPSYRSCDLCWLEDAENEDSGPCWGAPPADEGHGEHDGEVIADRIACLRAALEADHESE